MKTLWLTPNAVSAYDAQAARMRRIDEEGRSPAVAVDAYDGPVEFARPREQGPPAPMAAAQLKDFLDTISSAGVPLKVLRFMGDKIRCCCPFHPWKNREDNAVLFANGNFFCQACGAKTRSAWEFIALYFNKENPDVEPPRSPL